MRPNCKNNIRRKTPDPICRPERSEGSFSISEILRRIAAQNDTPGRIPARSIILSEVKDPKGR